MVDIEKTPKEARWQDVVIDGPVPLSLFIQLVCVAKSVKVVDRG